MRKTEVGSITCLVVHTQFTYVTSTKVQILTLKAAPAFYGCSERPRSRQYQLPSSSSRLLVRKTYYGYYTPNTYTPNTLLLLQIVGEEDREVGSITGPVVVVVVGSSKVLGV